MELIIVARIVRPHGRKGEVRLRLETDHPGTLFDANRIFLDGDAGQPATVEKIRMHKDVPLLKLADVDDMSAAEALRGRSVCLPFDELVPLESDEFFLHDLIGLDVFDHNGREVGRTQWILETGATPVLVASTSEGEEIMIPFSPDAVDDVSLEEGRLTLSDLPGLLDINRR